MVLAVESTWALGDTRVQPLEMIGASQHHESLIRFQAIDFIEKETLDAVCDQAVKVLEDQ